MKSFFGFLLLIAFTLMVQTVYSTPLQTDSKAGITNVMHPETNVLVFQSTIDQVATYPVQSIAVSNLGTNLFLERTQAQNNFKNIPITPVINIASNIRFRQYENLFIDTRHKITLKTPVTFLPYSRHVIGDLHNGLISNKINS